MRIKKIVTIAVFTVILSSFLVGCKGKDISDKDIDNDVKQESITDTTQAQDNDITIDNDNKTEIEDYSIEDIQESEHGIVYYIPNDNVDGLNKVTLKGNVGNQAITPQYIIDRLIKEGIVAQDTKVVRFMELEDGVYNLDLSKEFYTLSFGTSAEGLVLNAIGNSFIENFSCEKIKLTVEGLNYESGHIAFEDNDYITFIELNENSTESVKLVE